MYRYHLVVKMRVDHLQAGLEQFRPDNQSHGTTNQKHNERTPQVQRTDVLVVGSKQPAGNALGHFVVVMISDCCSHSQTPVFLTF